ncbi:MAG TPA: hypothetical protein VD866_30055 [Urbifossiella sp.]|nr:hypothetical protein [Urbifossiella sp.]
MRVGAGRHAGTGRRGDEFDAAPEADGPTRTVAGDLWVIGGAHRLLVGDATDPAGVARLLAVATPFLMVTDPPYGVDYDPDWRNQAAEAGHLYYAARRTGNVANDGGADWAAAYKSFPGAVAYVWHAGRRAAAVASHREAAGLGVWSQIVWRKPNFAISRGHYHWQHEPCWYAAREGKSARWCGDRTQSTVWDIQVGRGCATGASWSRGTRPSWTVKSGAHAGKIANALTDQTIKPTTLPGLWARRGVVMLTAGTPPPLPPLLRLRRWPRTPRRGTLSHGW